MTVEPEEHADGSDASATLLARAAAWIDAALPDRALVYGSAPPDARDLDLIVSEQGASAAADALTRAGFRRRGITWARFEGCAVGVVELHTAESLQLPPGVVDAVVHAGEPLPGLRRIVVPAGAHELVLLAIRLRQTTCLEPKHRRRIERALVADRRAWETAADAAGAAADDVLRLRRLTAGERVSGRRLQLRPPRVLAVCSPDGRRAAFHAQTLADAAGALGYAGAVISPGRWAALRAWTAVLRRLSGGGAVVVEAVSSRAPLLAPPPVAEFVLASSTRPGSRIRQVDPALPVGVACERIAELAWDSLSTGGRLRSVVRRLRRL